MQFSVVFLGTVPLLLVLFSAEEEMEFYTHTIKTSDTAVTDPGIGYLTYIEVNLHSAPSSLV